MSHYLLLNSTEVLLNLDNKNSYSIWEKIIIEDFKNHNLINSDLTLTSKGIAVKELLLKIKNNLYFFLIFIMAVGTIIDIAF